MRDWGTADRFAYSGAGATRRGNQGRARLRRGAGETIARDDFAFSENYGKRDGKYFDGGGAGRGRDRAGERCDGPGSYRPGGIADQDGSEDRGRGDIYVARAGRGKIAWCDAC